MFPRSEAEAADAHEILELCLGERAPFGLIDFLTGAARGSRIDLGAIRGDAVSSGHRCVLGSFVGSAYVGGQPRSIASGRNS